jgi:hypothetical protein
VGFLTALTNELRMLDVAALVAVELDAYAGPSLLPPIPAVSASMDNGVLLRTAELGPRLVRVVSVLKTRQTPFDHAIREFAITGRGDRGRGSRRGGGRAADRRGRARERQRRGEAGLGHGVCDRRRMATILVAEDELAIRELLAEVLGDEGHEVLVAADGPRGPGAPGPRGRPTWC